MIILDGYEIFEENEKFYIGDAVRIMPISFKLGYIEEFTIHYDHNGNPAKYLFDEHHHKEDTLEDYMGMTLLYFQSMGETVCILLKMKFSTAVEFFKKYVKNENE